MLSVAGVVSLALCLGGPFLLASARVGSVDRRPPVIFLPGSGGSQLEAKLNRHEDLKDSCPKSSDWFRLWLNAWYIIFGRKECWAANAQMYYDKRTGRSSNAAGVQTRVPGWGGTDSVDFIDPSWTAWSLGNIGQYAAPLFKGLVSLGYVNGHNLRAAPYDFRLAPHSQSELFKSLKTLVEDTYVKNSNQRVVLLAHSMGGLFAMYFLNQQPKRWKDHYIKTFISLNTPWTGTAKMLQVLASGYTSGIKYLDPWVFRAVQRSHETNLYMLPSSGISEYDWKPNEILMITPRRNYTVANLDQFFIDIGYPVANVIRRHFRDDAYKLKSPGVPFYCLHSSGVDATEQMVYEKGWDVEKRPTVHVWGSGDGLVNMRSLKGCAKTNTSGSVSPFYMKDFPGSSHNDIIKDTRLLDYLNELLTIG